jgi:hypothetical protein
LADDAVLTGQPPKRRKCRPLQPGSAKISGGKLIFWEKASPEQRVQDIESKTSDPRHGRALQKEKSRVSEIREVLRSSRSNYTIVFRGSHRPERRMRRLAFFGGGAYVLKAPPVGQTERRRRILAEATSSDEPLWLIAFQASANHASNNAVAAAKSDIQTALHLLRRKEP